MQAKQGNFFRISMISEEHLSILLACISIIQFSPFAQTFWRDCCIHKGIKKCRRKDLFTFSFLSNI